MAALDHKDCGVSRMRGTRRAAQRIRRMPDALEDAALEGIRETVNAVHREGRGNIDAMVNKRTGKLRRYYSKLTSRAKMAGTVGYRTAKAKNEAFYARFVHDGTANTTAKPFHDSAVEAEYARHSQRMRRALQKVANSASPSTLGRTGGRRV